MLRTQATDMKCLNIWDRIFKFEVYCKISAAIIEPILLTWEMSLVTFGEVTFLSSLDHDWKYNSTGFILLNLEILEIRLYLLHIESDDGHLIR